MAQYDVAEERQASVGAKLVAWLGRIFLAVIIPLIAFAVLYAGFIFLRDSNAPRVGHRYRGHHLGRRWRSHALLHL